MQIRMALTKVEQKCHAPAIAANCRFGWRRNKKEVFERPPASYHLKLLKFIPSDTG